MAVLVFAAFNAVLIVAKFKLIQKNWKNYYQNIQTIHRDIFKLKEYEFYFTNKEFTFLQNIWPKLFACSME